MHPREGQDPLSTACQVKGVVTFSTLRATLLHLTLGRLGGLKR